MAAAQLGSSEWRSSLLQQIYETFDVDGDCAPLLVVDSMLKQTHRWQVRMSSSLRSCRPSARSERRSGDPPRMLSFWGRWRLRGTPRRVAAIQWPTLRALSVAAHTLVPVTLISHAWAPALYRFHGTSLFVATTVLCLGRPTTSLKLPRNSSPQPVMSGRSGSASGEVWSRLRCRP